MTLATEQPGKEAEALSNAAEALNHEALPEEKLIDLGWAALPPSYRIPEVAPTLEEARAYCKRLAESHYENFHVVSWFLPKSLRPHFHALYAYCRISDDLGDEVGDTAQSLALLNLWGRELDACYEGRTRHPVFVALAETIRECSIPKQPLADLLTAFRQDQIVTRYATMEDVLQYCRYWPIQWAVWCSTLAVKPPLRNLTSGSGSLTQPARRCNWPTSGRMCARTTSADAFIFRRKIWNSFA